jgi:hypothetical protein
VLSEDWFDAAFGFEGLDEPAECCTVRYVVQRVAGQVQLAA